ncbi:MULTISPECIES: PAS domain-containing sensor histidine kinase [unclassified Kaistella]|uniref:sensor histidine kinase n=1 Tax=unclassified Kaistella TaxID=2762626 RepID=UPI0027329F11|nr:MULTISPECIES: HAMP domain-containing sensor histidine kinase [unclassified Kaistella]MDP2454219.1 HAMP domain-containing sensor histidine kinase [Kaistella sp. SH11-4b]MDP2457710.1 HAMP domain-containing sensor histidine kinase [Kaistella sp. SH40-3]MDP2460468.1 HAMP domain-containing sensor histidine kinase [Kaistella sp. SH19-2b]
MPFSKYKGYSLRNRVFWGFLLICFLSITGSSTLSYFILKSNATEQSKTDLQKRSESLMSALDYAVSHTQVQTDNLPKILSNTIFEIADINSQDIIIYDLEGDYLISNKDVHLIPIKKIPLEVVNQVLKSDKRVDFRSYDKKTEANVTSSYMILKNNMLEPIAIVYFPYYHNDSSYVDVFNKYLNYIIIVNLLVIGFGVWLSWIISNNLTKAVTKFSDLINRINVFDDDPKPIRYYKNDELNQLVKAYNKMILQINEQKERLSFKDKEEAWREMAKQVAHEVKNPLTPMKLTIQNFERKFDPNDPKILDKVKHLSKTMVDQIDLVATVANAFSQFAQLPEKNKEIFNLNKEIRNIINIFSDEKIYFHANKEKIMIEMDKIYLSRIITNLVSNARQASDDERENIINVDIEQRQKRIIITVEDKGVGIPEEHLCRIFEPNFTSKSSGMGLGLTMVRKMVEDYKGEISVKSEVGKGTSFIISLPNNL